MEEVKVYLETRLYIKCPNGCCEEDVEMYEYGIFKCAICGGEWSYNSEYVEVE